MSENRITWSKLLSDLSAQDLRRVLRAVDSPSGPYVTMAGRRLTCFCSNNYLGLANHPEIKAAAKAAVDRWGWGAGASRLVCGHTTAHEMLEARLSAFKGTEAALVCPTGYQANLAAIRGLAGKDDVILLDKLNHASIIDAALASGVVVRIFPHRNYDRLEELLIRTASARRRLIITDTVFSMDGDFADLAKLVELKTRYNALLCIDEAHATGIFGTHGHGLAEHAGVEHQIDITVGTLSKALGGIGGFIAASREIIDWLINTARPFIYTTAIPPAACLAACAALDLIDREPDRRLKLLRMAGQLKGELTTRGWNTGQSSCQIIPIIVGPVDQTIRLSQNLLEAGILIPPIRPPTVPVNQSRLRISLCVDHTAEDLDYLISTLGCK